MAEQPRVVPPQPTQAEREAFARWLARWLAKVAEHAKQGKKVA